jgi:hypothetical protein
MEPLASWRGWSSEDQWPELEARVQAAYQAPSRAYRATPGRAI